MIHIKEEGLYGLRKKVRKPRDEKKWSRPVCSCQLRLFFFFCPLITQHIFHVFCSKCIRFYKKSCLYSMLNIILVSSKLHPCCWEILKYTHCTVSVVTTTSLQEAKVQYTTSVLPAAGSPQVFIPFTPMWHWDFCLLLMCLIKNMIMLCRQINFLYFQLPPFLVRWAASC